MTALTREKVWSQQAVITLPWVRSSRLRAWQGAFPDREA